MVGVVLANVADAGKPLQVSALAHRISNEDVARRTEQGTSEDPPTLTASTIGLQLDRVVNLALDEPGELGEPVDDHVDACRPLPPAGRE